MCPDRNLGFSPRKLRHLSAGSKRFAGFSQVPDTHNSVDFCVVV
jgi:hypothetical protein